MGVLLCTAERGRRQEALQRLELLADQRQKEIPTRYSVTHTLDNRDERHGEAPIKCEQMFLLKHKCTRIDRQNLSAAALIFFIAGACSRELAATTATILPLPFPNEHEKSKQRGIKAHFGKCPVGIRAHKAGSCRLEFVCVCVSFSPFSVSDLHLWQPFCRCVVPVLFTVYDGAVTSGSGFPYSVISNGHLCLEDREHTSAWYEDPVPRCVGRPSSPSLCRCRATSGGDKNKCLRCEGVRAMYRCWCLW